MKRTALAISILLAALFGMQTGQSYAAKISVETTLFPLYDFARQVGKDRVAVSLLLPPGVEAHSFEPTPRDVVRINRADVFIYTSPDMEPWAEDVVAGLTGKHRVVVQAGAHVVQSRLEAGEEGEHAKDPAAAHDGHAAHRHHGHGGMDPHIWIDFEYAQDMVDAIASGLVRADPGHAAFYLENAEAYKKQLHDLDETYRETLAQCPVKVLVHGGHFAFGYMTRRYGLQHLSAYQGFSPDSEPTPKQLAALIRTVRQYKLHTVFYEELLDPKLSRTIAEETGAKLLLLHGAHNLTKAELASGITYLQIMRQNLENLKTGLGER